MTRRRLRPDEIDLWHRVVAQTRKMSPEERKDLPHPQRANPKPKPDKQPQPRLAPFSIGQKGGKIAPDHALAPPMKDQVAAAPVRMDEKSFRRMKRGKLHPEGKIDLHGMTIAQAHPALTGFILRSHAEGKRLVLVITGKGKHRDDPGPIPTRTGVMRHNVPQWLALPPLAPLVLQVTEAHVKHGGGGAYYVYLRRHR